MPLSDRDPLLGDVVLANGVPDNPSRNLNKVSNTKLYWILGALWTPVFLGAMDGTIVATLQQPIGEYFAQSHKASYISTSYFLSICCFTPLYGRLSDILGRKGAMMLALSLFTTGTLLCGMAPSMGSLIAARALAGMGGGGVMTVSSIVVTDLIPLRNHGLFQGLANITFGIGAGLGGPLGGYICDNFGWRTAFYFQVPLLIAAGVLVSMHVNIVLIDKQPLTIRQKLGRIDWLGSLTLVIFVGGLVLGLSLKAIEDLLWKNAKVWIPLAVSTIALAAFVFVEAKVSPHPVMPMRLLLRRTPLAVSLTNFFGSIVTFSLLYNVPLYFMAVRLQTAGEAGFHLLPNSVAVSVGSVCAGWIMRHTGKYWFVTMGATALSVAATVRIAFWDEHTSNFELWFDIVPNGLGFAATLTSTLIGIIACVPREDMAVATGITYLFRTTGQLLGVSLSGTLFQAVLVGELRERMPGTDASTVIEAIRHNAGLVRVLKGAQKQAAIASFAQALRVVFFCQVVAACIAVLCAIPIEERPLPVTHEEHDASHQRPQNPEVPERRRDR